MFPDVFDHKRGFTKNFCGIINLSDWSALCMQFSAGGEFHLCKCIVEKEFMCSSSHLGPRLPSHSYDRLPHSYLSIFVS